MRKLLTASILIATASLGGCASFNTDLAKLKTAFDVVTTATVSAPTAQVAVSSFEVIEAAVTEYLIYCKKSPAVAECSPGTIEKPGPLRLVIKYVRQGRVARDQIKASGKSGALISTTAYNVLMNAVSSLTASPVSTVGVPK